MENLIELIESCVVIKIRCHQNLEDCKAVNVINANGGQGVMISNNGHILTCAHVIESGRDKNRNKVIAVITSNKELFYKDHFFMYKYTHRSGSKKDFYEYRFECDIIKEHLNGSDLTLLKIITNDAYSKVDFYSDQLSLPDIGDSLIIAHYYAPVKTNDTIMVNEIQSKGICYWGEYGYMIFGNGFFRFGSSGAPVFKNNRLLGIQSGMFPLNMKDENIPMGDIRIAPVFSNLINLFLD